MARKHKTAAPATETPDVASEITSADDNGLCMLKRFRPGIIRMAVADGLGVMPSLQFTDLAAREIAIAILKRIASNPFDAAVYAAGWTGSHECKNGDPDCVHVDCCVCAESTSREDGTIPIHLCRGRKP
jgi:hypothetical protein